MGKDTLGICNICGREFNYDSRIQRGLYCSRECRYKDHSNIIKKSYTPELKEKKRQAAKNQMQDPEQIKIRCKKLTGIKVSEDKLEKMSENATKHGGNTYRKRALKHYGLNCARCGIQGQNENDFVVHHIDFNNFQSKLGNHTIENLMVLCKDCHKKLHHEIEGRTKGFAGLDQFEKAAHCIFKGLEQMGLDLNDENFKDTPKRVSRALFEIFSGVTETESQVDTILSTAFPSEGQNSMVIVQDIVTYSMCPHHLLPVEYTISIGYIPSKEGKVLGISKLARLSEILSKRPVLQETLTSEIVSYLEKIKPEGVMVVVEGRHYCMRMRGIKKSESSVRTSAVSGSFESDYNCRQEFLNLIK